MEGATSQTTVEDKTQLKLEEQSSTKPDYLTQLLWYTLDLKQVLDKENDVMMMEWERTLMRLYTQIVTSQSQPNNNPLVLNVGFGMSILPMFH